MTLIRTNDEQIEAYKGKWQDSCCEEEVSLEGKLSPLCNACNGMSAKREIPAQREVDD